MDLEEFIDVLNARLAGSHVHFDDKLGLVFYPCINAIEEGLERSMA